MVQGFLCFKFSICYFIFWAHLCKEKLYNKIAKNIEIILKIKISLPYGFSIFSYFFGALKNRSKQILKPYGRRTIIC